MPLWQLLLGIYNIPVIVLSKIFASLGWDRIHCGYNAGAKPILCDQDIKFRHIYFASVQTVKLCIWAIFWFWIFGCVEIQKSKNCSLPVCSSCPLCNVLPVLWNVAHCAGQEGRLNPLDRSWLNASFLWEPGIFLFCPGPVGKTNWLAHWPTDGSRT